MYNYMYFSNESKSTHSLGLKVCLKHVAHNKLLKCEKSLTKITFTHTHIQSMKNGAYGILFALV